MPNLEYYDMPLRSLGHAVMEMDIMTSSMYHFNLPAQELEGCAFEVRRAINNFEDALKKALRNQK